MPPRTNPEASAADDTDDLKAMLAQLVKSQQQTQQQFQQSQQQTQQQFQEMQKQLASFQQQQVELQKQQNQQQQKSTEMNLARQAAGAAPLFFGKAATIEVHRWCIAMERWFDTAQITLDTEKLNIVPICLKESAQSMVGGGDSSKQGSPIQHMGFIQTSN